jgi:sulfur relay (sulfurtransferase) DsrF/TusC family protein
MSLLSHPFFQMAFEASFLRMHCYGILAVYVHPSLLASFAFRTEDVISGIVPLQQEKLCFSDQIRAS